MRYRDKSFEITENRRKDNQIDMMILLKIFLFFIFFSILLKFLFFFFLLKPD